MTEDDKVHTITEWAKGRLDEMEATVKAMQEKGEKLQEQGQQQAKDAIAEAQRSHETFITQVQKLRNQGEAALTDAQKTMNESWSQFEAGVDQWVNSTKSEQEAFEARAQAQLDTWQKSIDQYSKTASEAAADQRVQLTASVDELKAQAQAAQKQLDAMRKAGASSWSAMSRALDQSRKAFEKAADKTQAQFDKALKS